MKRVLNIYFTVILITIWTCAGCIFHSTRTQHDEQIPSMLNLVTNKAQIAVEEEVYTTGGEQAVIAYIRSKNPDVLGWFTERDYELKIGVVADTAVVLVCDQGKAVYEDTYCRPGKPDRDHSGSATRDCKVTLTESEIAEICE